MKKCSPIPAAAFLAALLSSCVAPAGPTSVAVSLAAPAANAAYVSPASIALSASASATGAAVTRVDFYAGDALIGTDDTPADGWSCAWTDFSFGSHSLTAKAYDGLGQQASSAAVSISVSPQYIVFTTAGSGFSPIITVASGATVSWVFPEDSSGNTTSSSARPTISYGSAGTRQIELSVNPWSALTGINIGFDGGDLDYYATAIPYTNENLSEQDVTKVENLSLATGLTQWCSSHNPVASLDFSGCTALKEIECFQCGSLSSVTLGTLPTLARACFEQCALTSLDLSDCPALQDLRGALNQYPTLSLPRSDASLWHICVRENGKLTATNLFENMSPYPNLRQLFIWGDNQTGTLKVPSISDGYDEILADNNSYTSLDLRGAFTYNSTSSYGRVSINGNKLAAVYLQGCVQIIVFQAANNGMPSSLVDSILETLDGLGRALPSGGTAPEKVGDNYSINLTGNSAPGADGQAAAASLRNKGWLVNVDPVPSS